MSERIAASIVLLQANRELLLGRGAPPAMLGEMRAVVAAQAGVLEVPDLFAIAGSCKAEFRTAPPPSGR